MTYAYRLHEWLADHCRWVQYPVPRVVRTAEKPVWRALAVDVLKVVFAACFVLVILYRNRNTRGFAVGGMFLAALLAFLAAHQVAFLF